MLNQIITRFSRSRTIKTEMLIAELVVALKKVPIEQAASNYQELQRILNDVCWSQLSNHLTPKIAKEELLARVLQQIIDFYIQELLAKVPQPSSEEDLVELETQLIEIYCTCLNLCGPNARQDLVPILKLAVQNCPQKDAINAWFEPRLQRNNHLEELTEICQTRLDGGQSVTPELLPQSQEGLLQYCTQLWQNSRLLGEQVVLRAQIDYISASKNAFHSDSRLVNTTKAVAIVGTVASSAWALTVFAQPLFFLTAAMVTSKLAAEGLERTQLPGLTQLGTVCNTVYEGAWGCVQTLYYLGMAASIRAADWEVFPLTLPTGYLLTTQFKVECDSFPSESPLLRYLASGLINYRNQLLTQYCVAWRSGADKYAGMGVLLNYIATQERNPRLTFLAKLEIIRQGLLLAKKNPLADSGENYRITTDQALVVMDYILKFHCHYEQPVLVVFFLELHELFLDYKAEVEAQSTFTIPFISKSRLEKSGLDCFQIALKTIEQIIQDPNPNLDLSRKMNKIGHECTNLQGVLNAKGGTSYSDQIEKIEEKAEEAVRQIYFPRAFQSEY